MSGFNILICYKFFLFIGCDNGGVSNNHKHLRTELPTECKGNPEQLIKVYVV